MPRDAGKMYFFFSLKFYFIFIYFCFLLGEGYKGGVWDMGRLENGWDWGA